MKKNVNSVVYAIVMIIIIGLIISVSYKIGRNPNQQVINMYQTSFDLTKVPNGMVIWLHGVPEFPSDFIHADTSIRYKYFDVGILSKKSIVYKIRIPFYIVSLFQIGSFTKYQQPKKKGENPYMNKSSKQIS